MVGVVYSACCGAFVMRVKKGGAPGSHVLLESEDEEEEAGEEGAGAGGAALRASA